MAHLRNITLRNFKTFKEEHTFDFAPITILTGTNSSGKSNLLKALQLLQVSINKHLFFQTLDFNSNKRLGDFESSINSTNYTDINQTIDFRLPLALDYFEGPFFVELKFEKENKGFKNNGRLSSIRIYKEKNQEMHTLFHFSAATLKKMHSSTESYYSKFSGRETFTDNPIEILNTEYQYSFNPGLLLEELKNLKSNEEVEVVIDELTPTRNEIKNYIINLNNEVIKYKAKALEQKPSIPFESNTDLRNITLDDDRRHGLDQLKIATAIKLNGSKLLNIYFLKQKKGEPIFSNDKRAENEDNKLRIDLIDKIEQLTLSGLAVGNTDIDDTDFEMMQEDYFFTDQFITKLFFEKFKQQINEQLINNNAITYTDVLTEKGKYLLKELFLDNIEKAFKKLRETLDVAFLGSIRSSHNRISSTQDSVSYLNELIDEYIILGIQDDKILSQFVNYWLEKFNIGTRMYIETGASGMIKILVLRRHNKDINVADLGFGSSQIIPILLRISINAYKYRDVYTGDFKSSTICIEEPESNLHPALQSRLADLFIDAAHKFKIQFILETHSEYLIRKMQYWVAKKIIAPSALGIHYFYDPNNIPEKENHIKKINIRNDGMLEDDFGEGFYDEATRLTFELLKMQHYN